MHELKDFGTERVWYSGKDFFHPLYIKADKDNKKKQKKNKKKKLVD